MTVGELYKKVWSAAWDAAYPEAKGITFIDEAHRCLDAAVPGLWDAEVLDGSATVRFVGGRESILLRPRKTRWEQVVTFGRKRPFRRLGIGAGQRVGVIVLPKERADESGGDRSGP